MKSPLIPDLRHPTWIIFNNIINLFDRRTVKKEMAKVGIKPVKKAALMLRITITSIFFEKDITEVVEELKRNEELRRVVRVAEVPSADEIYSFLSKFSGDRFIKLVLSVINRLSRRKTRSSVKLLDTTDIKLDLNLFREQKIEYKWGYAPGKGFYKGFKLALVIEYPSLKPVGFYLYEGSPNDSKLFLEIVKDLKRRRILRKGDRIIADKGFCAQKNYWKSIMWYKILPFIFPRKNLNVKRITGRLSHPFEARKNEKVKRFYDELFTSFKSFLNSWENFKAIRSVVEDVFKVLKNSLSLKNLHRYSKRSVIKFAALSVLLLGMLISLGFNSKEKLQALAES